MQKRIRWLNDHILIILTLFLLAFIPLYPKLPLINVIRTWVYIRLEDFFVAVASGIFLFTLLSKRKRPDSPLNVPIVTYWIVGAVSLINALIFIFPGRSGFYPHLGILHFARRIEYMILCFLAYEAYRKKPSILPVILTLAGSYALIVLYGFGQKFFGFPAFLTMNEEFAKGVPLRLPPTARFPSTFGGHYDLAAYLVLTIPIMGSLMIGLKKYWQRGLFFVLTLLGLMSLLFTASRISFGVYLIVMTVMLLWQKRAALILPMIVISMLILNFTSGASERFYKTFRVSDVVVDLSTGKPIGTLDSLDKNKAVIEKGESPAEETLPKGSEYINISGTGGNQISSVQLYKSKSVTGAAGDVATVSGSFLIQKALVYDISITTRLQAEWPNAIRAFKRNLLLGSGYSSISVATDGDYHRMFGETGILGFIAFIGIFAAAFLLFVKRKNLLAPAEKSFVIGVFAGLVGLLVNAVLIDVFEASKVAYTLWSLLGIATAVLVSKKPFSLQYPSYLWTILTHKAMKLFYLVLAAFIIWGKTPGLYFMGDDFTWLKWAAESKAGSLLTYFTDSAGFFYRPIPKLWYFGLFSVFWLKPMAYHVSSILLVAATALLLFRLLRRRQIPELFAWFGALTFTALSVHHENVYWISGQSSLLAGFLLMAGIVLCIESDFVKRWKYALITLSFLSVFGSMLSYDGMIVAPVILFVISRLSPQKRYGYAYIALIPLYWWMRVVSGALAPEGDYGYTASHLLVNTAGNTAGYISSVFAGPSVIEHWDAIRGALRPYSAILTPILAVVSCVAGIIFWIWRKQLSIWREPFSWFACFFIALAAYIPLGGMAERYVYVASVFIVIGLVCAVHTVWKLSGRYWLKGIIFAVWIALLIGNIRDIQRLGNDWEKSGSVVEQSLRVIKQKAFPPMNVLHFFIVDMPIRFGRAWIFPTGLNDALWHIYRNSPYTVSLVKDLEQAFTLPPIGGDRRVFIYENLIIKEGVEETIITPVPDAHEKKP